MSPLARARRAISSRTVSVAAAVTLAALGLACGNDSSGPPYGPPTSFTKQAGDGGSAVVGTVVLPAPTLHIVDARGRPVPNVEVTFMVASGGGSVVGATILTDPQGNATVGSWTLGPAAGPNTLNAMAEGQVRAIFAANGTAGAPASIIKHLGDAQTAGQGTPVLIRPAVRVRDANGNPVIDAMVTFTVGTGGGILTGGSPLTDANGVATLTSWQLGSSGTNTLTATVAGLPGVTFSATATVRCTAVGTLTLGGSVDGTLTTSDCRYLSGHLSDWYTVTTATQQAFEFSVTSAAFNTFLELFTPLAPVAGSDNISSTNTNSIFKVIVPPGTYDLAVTSTPGASPQTGAYTVASSTTPESATAACDIIYVVTGIVTSQSLATTDCPTSGTVFYTDFFGIRMFAGRTYTITMVSSLFDPYLELASATGSIVGDDDGSTGNQAQVVYTPAATALFLIAPSSNLSERVGAYSLSIVESGGAAERPSEPMTLDRRWFSADFARFRSR